MADKKPAQSGGKRYGLILDGIGAPPTDHTVGSLDGLYRPDKPTPVGGDGEMPLERARELDADEGCPLKLVELDPDTKEK